VLDVWVCGGCHSVNRERSTSCYKCKARREQATGQGATLRQDRAIQARLVAPVRNTAPLAFVTIAFILAVVGFEIATTVIEIQTAPALFATFDSMANGAPLDPAPFDAFGAGIDTYGVPTLVSFLAAWLALAAWLSLSVANMPGLGGGEPPVDPGQAFIYTLIPGYTFRHVPGIIQALLYRLDPRAGGALVAGVAWFGLFGAFVFSWLAGKYFDIRIASDIRNASSVTEVLASLRDMVGGAVLIDVVTTGMIVVGALALAVTMIRVELRREARNKDVETALGDA
jgi:hypothetical protein